MRALRSGKLPLTLALVAVVVIGGPAFAPPHADPIVDAATVGKGVIRAVDATLADSADTRAGRADRHAPRSHGLPLLLPLTVFALGLTFLGATSGGSCGPPAVTRLRNSIGRRAPPALAAH
ncbi:MAG: hypothetical protein ACXW1M_08240 [Acidimicrobiia bacterium]